MSVSVSGTDSLRAKLANAGPKIRKAAGEVVESETLEIADDMRAAAPVDTGELRDSIQSTADDVRGFAWADARHAVFVEFGTKSAPEQPFILPTAEKHRRPYVRNMSVRINEELRSL